MVGTLSARGRDAVGKAFVSWLLRCSPHPVLAVINCQLRRKAAIARYGRQASIAASLCFRATNNGVHRFVSTLAVCVHLPPTLLSVVERHPFPCPEFVTEVFAIWLMNNRTITQKNCAVLLERPKRGDFRAPLSIYAEPSSANCELALPSCWQQTPLPSKKLTMNGIIR